MTINTKRVIIAGLVVNVVSFVIFPLFFSDRLFGWIFRLEPTNIWKWTPQTPLGAMPMHWLAFLVSANTVLALFIAFLYAVLYRAIPGKGVKKGLLFAVLMYPMSVLIPMFSIYVVLNVASEAVVCFTAEQLIEILVYGALIGLIYKEA